MSSPLNRSRRSVKKSFISENTKKQDFHGENEQFDTLIIEENTIYEIDVECMKKQRKR